MTGDGTLRTIFTTEHLVDGTFTPPMNAMFVDERGEAVRVVFDVDREPKIVQ